MSDIPCIMSAPMVQALLAGRKRMTRRLAWRRVECTSKQYVGTDDFGKWREEPSVWQTAKPGDLIWVRESLFRHDVEGWRYAVDKNPVMLPSGHPEASAMIAWAHHYKRDGAPAIHMPRWASRITLKVTATRIERLQDITEADAIAEGVQHRMLKSAACAPRSLYFVSLGADGTECSGVTARECFEMLWCRLHGAESWGANPDVVVVSFDVHQQNIDTLKEAA